MNYSGWAPGPRAFGDFYRRDILYGNAGPTGIRGELKPPTRRRRQRRRLRRRRGGGEEGERKDLFFSGGGERRPESTYLPVGLLLNPRSRLMDSSSPDRCMRTYDTNRPAPASFLGLVLLLSLSTALFPFPTQLLFPSYAVCPCRARRASTGWYVLN